MFHLKKEKNASGSPETKKQDKYYYASQWSLMYHKFRKHKLAMVSVWLLAIFYLVAIFGNFVAPQGTEQFDGRYVNCGPTPIHFFHEGKWEGPFVYGLARERVFEELSRLLSRGASRRGCVPCQKGGA